MDGFVTEIEDFKNRRKERGGGRLKTVDAFFKSVLTPLYFSYLSMWLVD
jgi:hypothetical protein